MLLRLLFPLYLLVAASFTNRYWIELTANTPVYVVVNDVMEASQITIGQTIPCKTQGTVRVNNSVLIAHDILAYARVVDVRKAGKKAKTIQLEVVRTFATDGQTINLYSPFIEFTIDDDNKGLGKVLTTYVLDNMQIWI